MLLFLPTIKSPFLDSTFLAPYLSLLQKQSLKRKSIIMVLNLFPIILYQVSLLPGFEHDLVKVTNDLYAVKSGGQFLVLCYLKFQQYAKGLIHSFSINFQNYMVTSFSSSSLAQITGSSCFPELSILDHFLA